MAENQTQSENTLLKLTLAESHAYAALCWLLVPRHTTHRQEWATQLQEKVLDELKIEHTEKKALIALRSLAENEVDPQPFIDLVAEHTITDQSDDARWIILRHLLTLCLRDGNYDARARTLLRQFVSSFKLEWIEFEQYEDSVAVLMRTARLQETNHRDNRQQSQRMQRWLLIGAAGVVGGVVLGITGGLAAPLVAGAIAGLGITGISGGFLASSAGIAVFTSLFGATGVGLTGYKMANRTKGVSEFEFNLLRGGDRMSVVIGVSGWLKKEIDAVRPWLCLRDVGDQYALQWETKELLSLSTAFRKILASETINLVTSEIIAQTMFASLMMSFVWPSALMKVADLIDNPWAIGTERAKRVGEIMADVLATKVQGSRPVTLIGYSLGARAIFVCLQELWRRRAYGIVENVYLIGTPVTADTTEWERASEVVSGRFVNAYSPKDFFLAFVYRTVSAQLSIAGISPINTNQVENIDISDIVPNHFKLRARMALILERIGVDVDPLILAAKKEKTQRHQQKDNEETEGSPSSSSTAVTTSITTSSSLRLLD